MSKLVLLSLLAAIAGQAWAGAALRIDGKVQSYEKPNFKILAPKFEIVIDGSKINEVDFERFRKAGKSQIVHATIPKDAIVSMKKLAQAPAAKKGSHE